MSTTLDTPRGAVTVRPTREDDAPAYRELRLLGLRDHPRRGFRVYGVEPEAIHHDGVYYDELLMARRL